MHGLLRRQVLSSARGLIAPGLQPRPMMQVGAMGKMGSFRTYKTKTKKETPFRYLFYTFLVSCAALYLAGQKVDKKTKPKTSFDSEREFLQYEEITGLRRRQKLINHEKNDKYKFFVAPSTSNISIDQIVSKIKEQDGNDSVQIKVIDPVELIEQEKKDESRKYCYLLHDLESEGKRLPKGLVTALIKEEVSLFVNTRNGTFDTNFIIKNYPQSTDEAIKFENDVSDVSKCYVSDIDESLDEENARRIENVFGYFETVDKTENLK